MCATSPRQVVEAVRLLPDGVIHRQGRPGQVLAEPRAERIRASLSRTHP